MADVEPKEVMNFGIESGVQLDDDTTLEVFGHLLAYWTITDEADFRKVQATAQAEFDVALAIYALIRMDRGASRPTIPLRATMHSWVEARAVSRANVIGTIHARYGRSRRGKIELGRAEAEDFATASHAAWRFLDQAPARLAFKDFGLSLAQRGDDAFLYAFRAIENVRRAYGADIIRPNGQVETRWDAMHQALGTDRTSIKPLTDAATAIRHGDPAHPALERARGARARATRLKIAADVLRRYLRDQGITW